MEETGISPKDNIEEEAPKSVEDYTQVPSTTLEILSKLFPEKKKSVLELVLRRCGDDLLKAIEQCNPLRNDFHYMGYEYNKRREKTMEKMKSFSAGMLSILNQI